MLPDTVRSQLVAAFVAAQRLQPRDVGGTRPGSVYYGEVTATRTSWAVADFTPSADAVRRSAGAADGGPLVQFQDGPWIFSRTEGAAWRLVTDTAGGPCPGQVPPALAAAWHLPVGPLC